MDDKKPEGFQMPVFPTIVLDDETKLRIGWKRLERMSANPQEEINKLRIRIIRSA